MNILLFSLLIFNLPCVRPPIIPCLSFPRLQTTFHTLNVTRIPKYIDSIMHFVQMGKLLNQNRGAFIWRNLALCIINNAFEFSLVCAS